MTFARLLATGSCLPEKILTNADLEKMVDTTNEWIVERSGIERRHIAGEGETTLTLAHGAAEKALETARLDPEALDMIIVGTCTPDRVFPSTACLLQDRLGIKKNLIAFDVTAACAGFLYGLNIAEQFIKTGAIQTALVVGSEVLSRIVDWDDRSTCVLFGDGAGCAIVQASDEPGIHASHLHAQGAYKDILYAPNNPILPSGESPYVHMLGREVFKVAVNELGRSALDIVEENQFTTNDIDWLVPHQANIRIIQSVAKKLNLPMEKVILTLADHGNTSTASIPLALDHGIRSGQIKRGQKLLLEAIGGGMAWGSTLLTY